MAWEPDMVISVFTDGAYIAPPIPFLTELLLKLHPSIVIVEKFLRYKAPPKLLAVLLSKLHLSKIILEYLTP